MISLTLLLLLLFAQISHLSFSLSLSHSLYLSHCLSLSLSLTHFLHRLPLSEVILRLRVMLDTNTNTNGDTSTKAKTKSIAHSATATVSEENAIIDPIPPPTPPTELIDEDILRVGVADSSHNKSHNGNQDENENENEIDLSSTLESKVQGPKGKDLPTSTFALNLNSVVPLLMALLEPPEMTRVNR